jgi:hypothetical protein
MAETPSKATHITTPSDDASIQISTGNSSTKSHRESLTALNIQRPPGSPRMGANRSSQLTENFRNAPLSPRSHRTSSVSSAAIQELLNNPPSAQDVDPAFAGRDWRIIPVDEIIEKEKVRFVTLEDSVEKATEVRSNLRYTSM